MRLSSLFYWNRVQIRPVVLLYRFCKTFTVEFGYQIAYFNEEINFTKFLYYKFYRFTQY
jgi:hypothetical protein